MKLNEKILYYRKRARLSQEELAAKVGVSRQAVSKWELGDATPEVDKLLALARVFGVTTDELLREEEPAAEIPPPPPPEPPYSRQRGFGFLVWLIRRYGWLAGIYVALSGAGITLVGGLARYSFYQMTRPILEDGFFQVDGGSRASFLVHAPLTFATVILAVGVIVLISGIILAVVLYRKGRKGD